MEAINEKVAVIIPVYNDEKRIGYCIESIINQEYQNLEILIINDGSKDQSGQICDEYASKDNRIRVIHQENKGLAFVRNLGISEIESDYLVFVDSDDYVSKNYVYNLMFLIQNSSAKLSACRFEKTVENHLDQNKKVQTSDFELIDSQDMLYRMLYHDGAEFSVWDKLYHKSLFEGIEFPTGELYEDIKVIPEIVKKAETIAIHPLADYFNFLQQNSIQRSDFNHRKLVVVDNINKILNDVQESGRPELIKAAIYRKCDIIIELMFQIAKPEDASIKEQLWSEFKQMRNIVIRDNHPKARKVRMAAIISYLGLPFFEKMYKAYTKSK